MMKANLSRREDGTVTVSIYSDDVWVGDGSLRAVGAGAVVIDDCPADLGDDIYAALEADIQADLERGVWADADPRA